MVESSEQITKHKVFKENHVREDAKEKGFESQWEMVIYNKTITYIICFIYV